MAEKINSIINLKYDEVIFLLSVAMTTWIQISARCPKGYRPPQSTSRPAYLRRVLPIAHPPGGAAAGRTRIRAV